MPWVLETDISQEVAKQLQLGDLTPPRTDWLYLKQKAALDFPTRWLPCYGRVAVDLTITERDGSTRTEHYPVGLPDPIPNGIMKPEEWAKPVVPGVVQARLYHSLKRPAFLPIVCLHSRWTRHHVNTYLSECTAGECRRWLHGVGRLEFVEDVSFDDQQVIKCRFISRAGFETIVDLTPHGLHIVY